MVSTCFRDGTCCLYRKFLQAFYLISATAKKSMGVSETNFEACYENPSTGEEILREIRALRRHGAPNSDGLSAVVFKDAAIEVIRELQVFS